MSLWKKGLSTLAAAACLLTSVLPTMVSAGADTPATQSISEEFVVGRFQYPGSIAEKDVGGNGFLGVTVQAPVPIDINGYNKENLAVRFTYRVTRSDGVTGPGSLSRLRNGWVKINDSGANECVKLASPTQNGVSGDLRRADEWLTVSYQLSSMGDTTGRLTSIEVGDYNDFPNKKKDANGQPTKEFEFPDGADTGMYLEVKDLRIVDTSKDADGNPIPQYTVTTFKGMEGGYALSGGQWYADWKEADISPVDLSDRTRYRLQFTLSFSSDDNTVDLDNCFKMFVIKLRSPDVTGKEGDSDKNNSEHNVGWKFTPDTLKLTNGSANISIELSQDGNDNRGLIDWSQIRRMFARCEAADALRDKNITMTLSNVQIVDAQAVDALRAALKQAMDQSAAPTAEADKAAYDEAYKQADALQSSSSALVSELQAAMSALKAARRASDADKKALRTALEEQLSALHYTKATWQAYQTARATAEAVLNDEGAAVTAVTKALVALTDAREALVERETMYGDVDNSETIDAVDALLTLQAAAEKLTLTDDQKVLANVDGEGEITAADALLILKYVTRQISRFPSAAGELSALIDGTPSDNPQTFCNPLNLNYEYQKGTSYNGGREAADPAVAIFKGKYWLFASHNEGYWYSDDMIQWTFVQVDLKKPVQDEFRRFAPATMVIGDYLYLTHSESGKFIRTTDPTDPNNWEDVGRPYEGILDDWQDPAWIYDDPADGGDGFVYGYKGSSATKPIVAVKYSIDLDTGKMTLVDGPVTCIVTDKENHGFEVNGENNTNYDSNPFLEGVWANRYDGKYYLTYGMPGTQFGSYADGCYVSDSPMGPYEYCENSPVSYKASGFVRGAGHGCLFADMNGKWWKVDTVSISVNGGFERRLDIFPATFKNDGATLENGKPYASLYANTVQGDYPMYGPQADIDNFNEPGPGWQLLSYGKTATASSTLNRGKATTKAVDENLKTWWSAATGDVGEWLQLDLGKVYRTRAVQVNFADQDTEDNYNGRNGDFSYKYLLEFSQDGETWYTIKDLSQNNSGTSHDYYEFAAENGVGMRYVRVTNKGAIPQGGKFAISGLRVFGDPVGNKSAAVGDFTVMRYEENERSVSLSWDEIEGAQGYIVRFGTAKDSLYNQCQVIGGAGVTLNVLNIGADYYFRIDSYNEAGVTEGTVVKEAKHTKEPTKPDPVDPDPNPDQPDQPQPGDADKVEGYTVYEAEQATVAVASKSGGHVGDMHKEGASITFAAVDGGAGGEASLHVIYSSGEGRTSKMKLVVNGEAIGTYDMVNTGNWNTYKMMEIPLTGLKAGTDNTIQMLGGDGGFNVDYIQVIYPKD